MISPPRNLTDDRELRGFLQAVAQQAGAPGSVRSVAVDMTLTTSDGVIWADTSAGNVTLTLPLANSLGGDAQTMRIVRPSALNTLTLARSGTDTVNGSTTATLAQGVNTLVSDGVSLWRST